jgi:dTDP-glucose 4,6-dehydratase
MIYFVTGGAGFIGTNFIYYMFGKYGEKIKIVNIDALTYAGNPDNLKNLDPGLTRSGNYVFEHVDICNSQEIERLFRIHRPDYVINFAAESHVDRSISGPRPFMLTNILGTQVLLDASLKYGVKRFHQISTDEVYGSLGAEGYFTETSPLKPNSPYSASKASADLICRAYYETYKLPVTISRCSNNYGPYQHPEKLIPLMLRNLLEGIPLPVYGDGLNVRDWLHVQDHCAAVDLILHQGEAGEIYNIGAHNEWSNIELVRLLIRKLRAQLPEDDHRLPHITDKLITFVEDRKGHDRRYAIDPAKIKLRLGWEPVIPFEKGLGDTIAWYLQNQEWVGRSVSKSREMTVNK